MRTSEELVLAKIYSRKDLRTTFGIIDKTIDTGIFKPKGHESVWIFVTVEKTKDMTPYRDVLDGDNIHWDGQTAGLKDRLIVEHASRGLELVVFWRNYKGEYPDFGFKYEGVFRYVSHSGGRPTRFHLIRTSSVD
jgi:hypothetical protein